MWEPLEQSIDHDKDEGGDRQGLLSAVVRNNSSETGFSLSAHKIVMVPDSARIIIRSPEYYELNLTIFIFVPQNCFRLSREVLVGLKDPEK